VLLLCCRLVLYSNKMEKQRDIPIEAIQTIDTYALQHYYSSQATYA